MGKGCSEEDNKRFYQPFMIAIKVHYVNDIPIFTGKKV